MLSRLRNIARLALELNQVNDSAAEVLLWEELIHECWNVSRESKHSGPDAFTSTKALQRIHKIARYRAICLDLVHFSRNFPDLAARLSPHFLPALESTTSRITFDGTKKHCHAHAEVQMVLHYVRRREDESYLHPRVLGTSKSACYLCGLTVQRYGGFFCRRFHGRLYDQWTMPRSVALKPKQRSELRKILIAVHADIKNDIRIALTRTNRKGGNLPMESVASFARFRSPPVSNVDSQQSNAVIDSTTADIDDMDIPEESEGQRTLPLQDRTSLGSNSENDQAGDQGTLTSQSAITNSSSTVSGRYGVSPGLPQCIRLLGLDLHLEIEEPAIGFCVIRDTEKYTPALDRAEDLPEDEIIDISNILPGQSLIRERLDHPATGGSHRRGDASHRQSLRPRQRECLTLRLLHSGSGGQHWLTTLELCWTDIDCLHKYSSSPTP